MTHKILKLSKCTTGGLVLEVGVHFPKVTLKNNGLYTLGKLEKVIDSCHFYDFAVVFLLPDLVIVLMGEGLSSCKPLFRGV